MSSPTPATVPIPVRLPRPWYARWWLGLIVPILIVVAWWLVTDTWRIFRENQLPPPRQVWAAVVELANGGELWKHLLASLGRIGAGFAIGAALALAVGVVVGLWRTAERLLDPTLQAVRSVPSLAWVPFLLLWLGIDETPKITLIAIGAFFPVYVNLVSGIRQADRKLVEVGAVFGLGPAEQIRRILLPAAAPYAITGLRLGVGQAWLFLVAAELIASTRGLGFLLVDGQNNLRPDIMVVGILLLALLGAGTDALLRLAERRLLRWADTFQGGRP